MKNKQLEEAKEQYCRKKEEKEQWKEEAKKRQEREMV